MRVRLVQGICRSLSVACVAALASCAVGATTPLKATDIKAAAASRASTVEAGICIDTSGSMPTVVSRRAIATLVSTVADWVPSRIDYSAGATPQAGLDLRVRRVIAGSSLAVNSEIAHVVISGVPSVIAKPDVTDNGYVDQMQAWRDQAPAAGRASAHAQATARLAAQAIRNADWVSDGSEIAGCLEALAATTQGASRRLVLVSDLDQTSTPQIGLTRFDGASVLVFHVCSDTSLCLKAERAWRSRLQHLGAVAVEFQRPEQVSDLLPTFLHTGRI